MRASRFVPAAFSLLLALPAGHAGAQSVSANAQRGEPAYAGGHNEEAYALKLIAPVNERRPPRHLRKLDGCSRTFKTLNVDGVVYVAILDCNDRQM